MRLIAILILVASIAAGDWVHVSDGPNRWAPRTLPENYAEWGSGYPIQPAARHYADGWRVADSAIAVSNGCRVGTWRTVYGETTAGRVVDTWVNLAAEQAAQAKADADLAKAAETAENARIMALPSIAAIVAENAALKVAAKEQAVRQAKELETLQAALTAARDVAAVAVAVKEWAIKEKSEKDSAAAVSAEVPK